MVDSNERISAVTIGYCLSDLYWNQGYMTEALEKVLEFFFEEVDVNRVESKHSVHNPASGRVMQKAGLLKEGVLKQGDMSNIGISDPNYGKIICRCENVSEAEIIAAINRPGGAKTVDGVKRRVRAGMGRCQGGFCGPRVLEILARELKVDPTEIKKDLLGSEIVIRHLKR